MIQPDNKKGLLIMVRLSDMLKKISHKALIITGIIFIVLAIIILVTRREIIQLHAQQQVAIAKAQTYMINKYQLASAQIFKELLEKIMQHAHPNSKEHIVAQQALNETQISGRSKLDENKLSSYEMDESVTKAVLQLALEHEQAIARIHQIQYEQIVKLLEGLEQDTTIEQLLENIKIKKKSQQKELDKIARKIAMLQA